MISGSNRINGLLANYLDNEYYSCSSTLLITAGRGYA